MKIILIALFALIAATFSCLAGDVTQAPVPSKHFDRVIHIILENSDYQMSLKTPYLNDLAKKGTLFTNFHAILHIPIM